MNTENIMQKIEESNIKAILVALSSGKISVTSDAIKDIPQETIEKVCGLKLAYNINNKTLVTKKYIYDCVLSIIKKAPEREVSISIDGVIISPSFINNVLEEMIKDGLINYENMIYSINYKNIITPQEVEFFLKGTIGVLSTAQIMQNFGIPTFKTDYRKSYSEPYQYCKEIITNLVIEEKVAIYDKSHDSYYWIGN